MKSIGNDDKLSAVFKVDFIEGAESWFHGSRPQNEEPGRWYGRCFSTITVQFVWASKELILEEWIHATVESTGKKYISFVFSLIKVTQ